MSWNWHLLISEMEIIISKLMGFDKQMKKYVGKGFVIFKHFINVKFIIDILAVVMRSKRLKSLVLLKLIIEMRNHNVQN